MNGKLTFWVATVFSVLALILLVINIVVVTGNRNLQNEVNQRQASITRATTVNQANQGLIRMLAESSVKNSDSGLRALLTSQGITVNAKAPQASSETQKP